MMFKLLNLIQTLIPEDHYDNTIILVELSVLLPEALTEI